MRKLLCVFGLVLVLAAPAMSDVVEISESNFPDPAFREYIMAQFDTNSDSSLSVSELEVAVGIYASGKGITRLDGIEHFIWLKTLDCSKNQISKLDLRDNIYLETLNCSYNSLTKLNISKNVYLTFLNCSYNQLEKLDVSKNIRLTALSSSCNHLTQLDITSNTDLITFDCAANYLSALDVSNNVNLSYLYCGYNQLKELDVSKNVALTLLECSYNHLTQLDLSNNDLTWLECACNHLAELDINNDRLEHVFASNQTVIAASSLGTSFDFHDIVRDISGITSDSIKGYYSENSYAEPEEFSDGTAIFATAPKIIKYSYGDMSVTVSSKTNAPKPVLYQSTIPTAEAGQNYNYMLPSLGSEPVTWSITKGKPINGITLYSNGLLSGTATKAGKTSFTVQALDAYGNAATRAYTMTSYAAPKIITDSLTEAIVGKPYSFRLLAKGSGRLEWQIVSGDMPEGLTFDTNTGTIRGTPRRNGVYTLGFAVTSAPYRASKTLNLSVRAILPKITTQNLQAAVADKFYTAHIRATGTEPITFEYSGMLPNGLSLDAETGTISGTPKEICTDRKIIITASNMGGSVRTEYSLTVTGIAPKINTSSLADASTGRPYNQEIEATGTAPITFSASGLPDGLVMDASTGHISGTTEAAGTFSVTITAENGARAVTKRLKLTVNELPAFWDDVVLTAAAGVAYQHKFNVTGTGNIALELVGTLPDGMSFSGGTLKGTPKEAGTHAFTLTATNIAGTVTQVFTLAVLEVGLPQDNETAPEADMTETEQAEVAVDGEAIYAEGTGTGTEAEGEGDGEEDNSGGADYVIVYEMPQIYVYVSGMYDFDIVLSDDVRTGAKLIWLAGNAIPSEDDEIAEFYDEEGADIDMVPESKNITVSAWLNEGTIYSPKIAIQ